MPCGCQKKSGALASSILKEAADLLSPSDWGPILWKYLHILTEHIGTSGNTIIDTDQANYMETLLQMLPLIIPCQECQAHTAVYYQTNPVPTLKGLYKDTLQSTVRQWLFQFHTAVRLNLQQPVIVQTVEECAALYQNTVVPKCEYSLFIQGVAAAVRRGWVRIDNWKKWYSNSERMRIISGNVVV
jgi:hypothetical protein